MNFREQISGTGFQLIHTDGQDLLFPELEKDPLLDSYKGKGYPCSDIVDFVSILAEHYWSQESEVIKRIQHAPVFQTEKRDAEKKLTIGIYYRNIKNGGAQRITSMLANLWAQQTKEDGTPKYEVVLITDEPEEKTSEPEKDRTESEVEKLFPQGKPDELAFLKAYDFSRFDEMDLPEYEVDERVLRAFLPPHETAVREKYRQRAQAWNRIIDEYQIDVVVSGLWAAVNTFWDMLCVKGHSTHPAFILQNHNFCVVPYLKRSNVALRLMHMYSMCDSVVTLSAFDRDFVSHFASRVRYLPNPIELPETTPLSAYESDTLLWVGRFAKEKNPLDVLEVIYRVTDTHPNVKLYMVGTGDRRIIIELLLAIRELGLEENVILPGFTLEVEPYYQKASVFLSTSLYEGFPTTTAEAFSFGLPIVEYEMPWLAFSQDERGIIPVPQGDCAAMADAVCKLLEDPDLMRRTGKAGKEKITEFCRIDLASEWESLFQEVFVPAEDEQKTDVLLKFLTEYQQIGKEEVAGAYEKKYQNLRNKYKDLNLRFKELKKEQSDGQSKILMKAKRKIKNLIKK